MAKHSFIVHTENTEYMDVMSDEQLGKLFKAQVAYSKGIDPEIDDAVVKVVFAMIKGQMDKDAEKYEEVCTKKAESGKIGADKRWHTIASDSKCHEEMANDSKCHNEIANDSTAWQGMAKIADYDNDNDLKEKEKDKKKKKPAERMVLYPDCPELDTVFNDYIEYRKQIKQPMTEKAVQLAMNKLELLSRGNSETAIAIINQSIMNGWKGLFELKQDTRAKPTLGIKPNRDYNEGIFDDLMEMVT